MCITKEDKKFKEKLNVKFLKGCYEMTKALCCIGCRSEDGGVDLENILKKLQI